MLIITVEVHAGAIYGEGIKEQIAMDLERFGDVRVTEVREVLPQQLRMGGEADDAKT